MEHAVNNANHTYALGGEAAGHDSVGNMSSNNPLSSPRLYTTRCPLELCLPDSILTYQQPLAQFAVGLLIIVPEMPNSIQQTANVLLR